MTVSFISSHSKRLTFFCTEVGELDATATNRNNKHINIISISALRYIQIVFFKKLINKKRLI